jgi:carboxylesterase type B
MPASAPEPLLQRDGRTLDVVVAGSSRRCRRFVPAFRDTAFAWPTWAWAMLQSQKGKGKAYVYYFDHRTPQSPNGATHGSEIVYVFKTLNGPGLGVFGLSAPRPADLEMSELINNYWVNFAKVQPARCCSLLVPSASAA